MPLPNKLCPCGKRAVRHCWIHVDSSGTGQGRLVYFCTLRCQAASYGHVIDLFRGVVTPDKRDKPKYRGAR